MLHWNHNIWLRKNLWAAAAAAKSLQSCLTLCDPIDGSPPGSAVPGILQPRTLEWVAISFSNAWKWKVKVSCSVMSNSSQPHGLQPTRLLRPWGFPGKSTGVGCHCLLCSLSDMSANQAKQSQWFVHLHPFYPTLVKFSPLFILIHFELFDHFDWINQSYFIVS